MAYTYEELKGKTVAELREIAHGTGHEDLKGAAQMNKEHLLPVLCKVLGVQQHHVVRGIDKGEIKLKKQRDAALEANDHAQLKSVRRQLHRLNHQIRAHMQ
jgi:hypothetical protein